jgi:cell division protein FtsZ
MEDIMPKFATIDQSSAAISGSNPAVLKVVGVGGGGCNAVDSMKKRGLSGVEFVAINTDSQVLQKSGATSKLQIGKNITRGLGAGADPNVGKKAAEEDKEKIKDVLQGSDMVFITAGMGGGTGTGASPLVASVAKSLGSLVVGIVTKPFKWEGKKRTMNAEQGINEIKEFVDSLIVIPNERILNIMDETIGAFAAFDKPNEVLYEATRGIAEIINVTGNINADFADVRAVMTESGEALMGCGIASGDNRAIEAAQKAIHSPLLDGISIKGAKNILLNVTGSKNLTMNEVIKGNEIIYDAAGEEANVIFGLVQRDDMNENISYTVIATGFTSSETRKEPKKSSLGELNKVNKLGSTISPGYTPSRIDLPEKTEDLDVPTIIRVKGTGSQMISNDNIPKPGYEYQQMEVFEEKNLKEKSSKNNEDSSSFLRMMMD